MSENVRPSDRVIHWMAATVVALLVLPAVGCWVFKEWDQAHREWRYREANGRLRKVGTAVQMYATRYDGWTPAGGMATDASPEWSWQVQLLPFLDRDDLYSRIDFRQRWDAGPNREVTATSLETFLSPYESKPASHWELAITHQAANARVFDVRHGVNLDEAMKLDGLGATLMLGEIGTEFPPWAKPGNVRELTRGLGGGPGQFGRSQGWGGFVMFLGGNGKYLSADTSPRVLELLADPNNGVPRGDEF